MNTFEKNQIMAAPVGWQALELYTFWCTGKRDAETVLQSKSAFMETRFFNHFIKFSRWVQQYKHISDVFLFVDVMKLHSVCPSLWRDQSSLSLFTLHNTGP